MREYAVFPLLIYLLLVLMWVSWLTSFWRFNAWINILLSILVLLSTWRHVRPKKTSTYELFKGVGKKFIIALLVLVFAVSAINFVFFHDTFSGSRDEGVYANNAVYLSTHGVLPHYEGKGKETRLFLNTSWFAELYGLMGFRGIKLANLLPFCLALVLIFLFVCKISKSEWPAMVAVTLIAFSYPLVWYSRRTCNEIIFFSVFWIAIFFFHRCFHEKEPFAIDYTISLLAFSILPFIRLEGALVAFVVTLVTVFFLFKMLKKRNKDILRIAVVALLLIVAITSVAFGLKLHLGKGVGETVKQNLPGHLSGFSGDILAFHEAEYSTLAMIRFGFMPAILCLIPFFYFLVRDRETRFFSLFLLAVFIPFAYFLYKPNIVVDFPWFFRRFIAVFIPLSLIAFCYVVFKLKKIQAILISILLLTSTIVISAPILFRRDYKGMIVEVGRIARLLPDNSTVLVDRYAAGDYVLDYPLFFIYGKETIRVVPWEKLTEEDTHDKNLVYFVTNSVNYTERYNDGKLLFDSSIINKATEVGAIRVKYRHLVPTCEFMRGEGALRWKSMDYRAALSQIKVPTRFITGDFEILVMELELARGP